MKVTREQILAIMPNAKDKVDAFLPYINGYADTYKITTPKRMAQHHQPTKNPRYPTPQNLTLMTVSK